MESSRGAEWGSLDAGAGVDVALEVACVSDLSAVRRLVVEAGLPSVGVEDQFPDAYVVLRCGGVVVGTAGLEIHGASGLLRSVAVAASHRGHGLGQRLVDDRLREARARGLGEVYLLTTTAPALFARLGFERVTRASASAELQRSSEFASVCPAEAVCMRVRLA